MSTTDSDYLLSLQERDRRGEATAIPDTLATAAAETAWLEYAKGTWSETDRRIFMEGFRQGWRARLHHVTAISKADAEEYPRRVNGVR